MAALPIHGASIDFIVAHGIWNLARSGDEFRGAVREAARVARPGAALFVFTFSRHTLPADVEPVAGETFVFTQFSGAPQCFLTERATGRRTARRRLRRPTPRCRCANSIARRQACARGGPVIYEGAFRLS